MVNDAPVVSIVDDVSVKLLARWQSGDQQAADELFRRYADRLIALAGSRLFAGLRHRIDPEDVVQSAYRSFFVGARAGRYELERGGDLWRLLVAITVHKLQDQIKYHTAASRNVNLERRLVNEDGLFGIRAQVLVQEPSPIAAIVLIDEVQQLMRDLPVIYRRILELRLQGYTMQEIADQTNRSVPTVFRLLEKVRLLLEQQRSSS